MVKKLGTLIIIEENSPLKIREISPKSLLNWYLKHVLT
jgi:hypothetical protein